MIHSNLMLIYRWFQQERSEHLRCTSRGDERDFDYLYRPNYRRCCEWLCTSGATHASIPHSCMYFVCCRLVCNTTATPSFHKKHLTGALFKRQRIDGNLWQWRAGHSWVSISPLSLWTPGSDAAKHNAPLSPPAIAPVPRGEMDKREIEGEKWEEEVMAEELEIIMFNSKHYSLTSHSRKRCDFVTLSHFTFVKRLWQHMLGLWIKVHWKVGKYLKHSNAGDKRGNLDGCDSANQRAVFKCVTCTPKPAITVGICSTENRINVVFFW